MGLGLLQRDQRLVVGTPKAEGNHQGPETFVPGPRGSRRALRTPGPAASALSLLTPEAYSSVGIFPPAPQQASFYCILDPTPKTGKSPGLYQQQQEVSSWDFLGGKRPKRPRAARASCESCQNRVHQVLLDPRGGLGGTGSGQRPCVLPAQLCSFPLRNKKKTVVKSHTNIKVVFSISAEMAIGL